MAVGTKLFTIGYGGKKPADFFSELEELAPDFIVDVRENPNRAYLGCYTRAHFEKRLEQYVWIKELGNSSRKLPPKLVDEAEGMAKLEELCNRADRIVLLCAEKDESRCHRGYIKTRIEGILDHQD